MGMIQGDTATYPNLAWTIGSCRPEQAVEVAEKILLIQRDFGDRTNRKHARLKYTILDRGLDWFRAELARRLGWELAPPRPYRFEHHGDRYGWAEGTDGRWDLTLFIENGRICDTDDYPLLSGLRAIAREHHGDLRLTANQHLVIGNVTAARRPRIEELSAEYRLRDGARESGLRRNAMACVALPTCGLAMAESERYLPRLLEKLESLAAECGLAGEEIVVRMTGCPNGCARAYLAEIGFVGRAPGLYNLYLGGDFTGERLNRLYRENLGEQAILAALAPILRRYAQERTGGERFGDFVIRAGYVRAVAGGRDFHAAPEGPGA
jgi:sulfite reductase (NADPH) hemoprotein beta-component